MVDTQHEPIHFLFKPGTYLDSKIDKNQPFVVGTLQCAHVQKIVADRGLFLESQKDIEVIRKE